MYPRRQNASWVAIAITLVVFLMVGNAALRIIESINTPYTPSITPPTPVVTKQSQKPIKVLPSANNPENQVESFAGPMPAKYPGSDLMQCVYDDISRHCLNGFECLAVGKVDFTENGYGQAVKYRMYYADGTSTVQRKYYVVQFGKVQFANEMFPFEDDTYFNQ